MPIPDISTLSSQPQVVESDFSLFRRLEEATSADEVERFFEDFDRTRTRRPFDGYTDIFILRARYLPDSYVQRWCTVRPDWTAEDRAHLDALSNSTYLSEAHAALVLNGLCSHGDYLDMFLRQHPELQTPEHLAPIIERLTQAATDESSSWPLERAAWSQMCALTVNAQIPDGLPATLQAYLVKHTYATALQRVTERPSAPNEVWVEWAKRFPDKAACSTSAMACDSARTIVLEAVAASIAPKPLLIVLASSVPPGAITEVMRRLVECDPSLALDTISTIPADSREAIAPEVFLPLTQASDVRLRQRAILAVGRMGPVEDTESVLSSASPIGATTTEKSSTHRSIRP